MWVYPALCARTCGDNTEGSQRTLGSLSNLAAQAKISEWLSRGRYEQKELLPASEAGLRPRCHFQRCTEAPSQKQPMAQHHLL